MKKTVVFSAIWSALLLVAVIPTPAHAIQTHAAPEGLYVHQVGHVLFALWNGWAFFGHILESLIPLTHFSRGSAGLKSILDVNSSIDVLYYLFKMDHFICFPALVFIYIALRQMTAQSAASTGDEDNLS